MPRISARPSRLLVGSALGAGVLVAFGLAAILGGSRAVFGLAAGLVLLTAFLLTGRIPLALGKDAPAALAFLAMGINYVLRVILLLLALRALREVDWLDRRVLGGTVIAGALLWSAGQVYEHLSSRRPSVDPEPSVPVVEPAAVDEAGSPDEPTPSDQASPSGEVAAAGTPAAETAGR